MDSVKGIIDLRSRISGLEEEESSACIHGISDIVHGS